MFRKDGTFGKEAVIQKRTLGSGSVWDICVFKRSDQKFIYLADGSDKKVFTLRRDPLEVRKATLRSMLAKAGLGLRFNEHMEGDGPTVFAHACKMGLEGIVSKRKDSPYRSGRSPDWLSK